MNRKQFEAKFLGGLIFGKHREMLDALEEADKALNDRKAAGWTEAEWAEFRLQTPVETARKFTPECVHDAWVPQVYKFHEDCLRQGGASHVFYLTTGINRLLVAFDGQTLKTELLGASDDVRRKWEGE